MTYRNLAPWIPLEELLLKPLRKRILYIRTNLAPMNGGENRRTPYLTQDEFAIAVGAPDRHRAIGWEKKGQAPRDYAGAIAALTDYPPAALGADGEEQLFEETLGGLLRSLRAEAERNRRTLARILSALSDHGIEIPDEAA